MNALNFESLDPVTIPVKIGNRDFVLKEASVSAACEYQNAATACTIYNDKGFRIGHKGLADVDHLLVSKCLVEVKDGGMSAVSIDEIRGWPDRIQRKLYDTVCKISNLNQPETLEELQDLLSEVQRKIEALKKGEMVPNGLSTTGIASS